MPGTKIGLVLCDGWAGVHAHVDELLRERSRTAPLGARDLALLVPTAAAGHLLRSALGRSLLARRRAAALPAILTRADLYAELAERSLGRCRPVDPIFREALLERVLEEVAEKTPPPFALRTGLPRRVLELWDHLSLSGFSFEELAARGLDEFDVEGDAGAERMAAETRFLRESLERYRERLSAFGLHDPSGLGPALRATGVRCPFARIMVLGAHTIAPADLAYLAEAPGVERIEIVVPRRLSQSFPVRALERVARLPSQVASRPSHRPRRLSPGRDEVAFTARDREEVLWQVAHLLKHRAEQGRLPALEDVAVVVPAPLPYLYLAKKVFSEAGIPYELQDDFPLAGEPYLAAVDQVLEYVALEGHRSAALGLLRSPFFRFPGVGPATVAALDRELVRRHEPGGRRAWRAMLERMKKAPRQPSLPGFASHRGSQEVLVALEALVGAGEELAALRDPATSVAEKIASLRGFLQRFGRDPAELGDGARHERARRALASILQRLERASRDLGPEPVDFHRFREKLHRAVESHTFSARTGRGGVRVVDARSAPLGLFDLVVLVGLNEGEWPERSERSIFYPQWLLKDFGWPTDKETLAAQRSAFIELVRMARGSVAAFRHQLERDVPTVVSPFLEELGAHTSRAEEIDPGALRRLVVSRSEALRFGIVPPETQLPERRRPGLVTASLPSPEPVSATAFEMYLRCPFKYYARYVLRIEEEEDLETTFSPLERGRVLHEILRDVFERWDSGEPAPRPVTEENHAEALDLFRRVAAEHLPPERRAIEMKRLFGGPGHAGAFEWLLRREMERGPLRLRFVEHAFQNPLRLEEGPAAERPWFVRVKGRADRVDVDAEGGLHVFDYKSGRAPEPRVTLQAPLYAMCLAPEVSARAARAAYVSLRDCKVVPREDYQRAASLLRDAFAGIAHGAFPPRPYQDHLCQSCGYVGLCRKEIEAGLPEERS